MFKPKDYYKDLSLKSLPHEVWKRVPNKLFYSRYAVSNMGRIKRIKSVIRCRPDRISKHGRMFHLKSKMLKSGVKDNGYLFVQLHYGGHRCYKHLYVHRLVLAAFKPAEYNKYPQVNHINEVKTDNRVVNLEGCTAEYNNLYGHRREKQSMSSYTHNIIIGNLFVHKLFSTSQGAAKWLESHIKTSPNLTALRGDIVRAADMNNTHSHLTHGYYCYLYKDYRLIMNRIYGRR